METHEYYLEKAFETAFYGIRNNMGGPFGAVIVRDGKIIAAASNQVTSTHDATAHAEVAAIRKAGAELQDFDLTGSILYTTCQPCPMCLSAIYWAHIDTVYYCSTQKDAEAIGFADNHIYEELGIDLSRSSLNLIHMPHPLGEKLFREWAEKEDKIEY